MYVFHFEARKPHGVSHFAIAVHAFLADDGGFYFALCFTIWTDAVRIKFPRKISRERIIQCVIFIRFKTFCGKSIAALFFAVILYIYIKYADAGKRGSATFIADQSEDVFSIITYRKKYEALKAEKDLLP